MASRRRRPRGYIEELPSGSFRAVVYAGTDALTRRPRYVRETVKSLAAAEVALTELQRQVDEDAHPKTDITVSQAVCQWLKVAKLQATTRERLEQLAEVASVEDRVVQHEHRPRVAEPSMAALTAHPYLGGR